MIKILEYDKGSKDAIFARVEPKTDVSGIVSDIIEAVRKDGDAPLLRFPETFDKA